MPRLHMSAEKTSRCHTRQRARAALLQAAMQCLRATELHDEVKVAVLMVRLPKLHNKLVGPALRTEQLHLEFDPIISIPWESWTACQISTTSAAQAETTAP